MPTRITRPRPPRRVPHVQPPPSAPRHPAYLAPLQGLRFLAALHIVLLHTLHAPWLPTPLARLTTWGSSTASLFFILSGFVLTWTYAAPGQGMRIPARQFWRRRAARLVPLALLAHLVVVPLVWSHYAPGERWPRALAAATGLQAWYPPFADSFNSPAWSLSFLALGFLLLPWLLRLTAQWTRARLLAAMAGLWVWMLVPAIAYALVRPEAPAWKAALYSFPLVRLPEFLFGVVLARLFALRTPRLPHRWQLPAVVAVILAGLTLTPTRLFPLNHNGLFAPVHAALIWTLGAGGGRVGRWLSLPAAQRLGDASFAVYLLHVPVYAWMVALAGGEVASWRVGASLAFYVAYLALTVLLAVAAERWIAAPLARRLAPR